jgi:hypothetical protein
MSYKDPQQQRTYQREYKRLRRAGDCQTPGQTQIPADFRLHTAQDVLELLSEQVAAVRADNDVSTTERARTVGYLCAIALRAVETADMAERIDAIERALKQRKANPVCETSWPAVTTNG